MFSSICSIWLLGVRDWFSLGFEALPAFPSLLTLECGLWFVEFKASVSSLIESAGLLATPFPLLLETPPWDPNRCVFLSICSIWLLVGFVVCFHPGLRNCLNSITADSWEWSLVHCVSRRRFTVCMSLRVFWLLLFPFSSRHALVIPTVDCSGPFVSFGT